MDPTPCLYDVFVSYSHEDQAWVRNNLVPPLEAMGWRICIDFRDFEVGANTVQEVERAIKASRKTLLVLTQDYLQRSWTTYESLVLQTIDPANLQRTLIPLLRSKCTLPKRLEFLVHVNFVDPVDWSTEWKKLVKALGKPPARTRSVSARKISGRSFQNSQFGAHAVIIQELTKGFVGRIEDFQALDSFMSQHPKGYFLVRAGPGAGKSAFCGHLVKKRNYIHHFVSRTGGRSDARLILRSLLAQLIPITGSPLELPNGLPALSKRFEDDLSRLVESQKRVVVVIDGVDELSSAEQEVPIFPNDGLADAVYFVVTSRPGKALAKLLQRLYKTPHTLHDLTPLKPVSLTKIIRSREPSIAPQTMKHLIDRSQGNPLFLLALLAEVLRAPDSWLDDLPSSVEDLFQYATVQVRENPESQAALMLGVLAVARAPLSMRQLTEILKQSQRQRRLSESLERLRPFLLKIDSHYSLYHTLFRDFVREKIVGTKVLPDMHKLIVEWLLSEESSAGDYRLSSLAFHMWEAGERALLLETLQPPFLTNKAKAFGYMVFEDIELLARCILYEGKFANISEIVSTVSALDHIVGGTREEVTQIVQSHNRIAVKAWPRQKLTEEIQSIDGVDAYSCMVTNVYVASDILEIVPVGTKLVAAIGDVPGTGLRSAFVARFIGNLFRQLITKAESVELGATLLKLNSMTGHLRSFEAISFQCIEIDPVNGVLTIASAAHPFPVLYSKARGTIDRIPVRGAFVNPPYSDENILRIAYQERHLELEPGDVFIMLTDGVTQAHVLQGEAYDYKFVRLLKEMDSESAEKICKAILAESQKLAIDSEFSDDDASIFVAVISGVGGKS